MCVFICGLSCAFVLRACVRPVVLRCGIHMRRTGDENLRQLSVGDRTRQLFYVDSCQFPHAFENLWSIWRVGMTWPVAVETCAGTLSGGCQASGRVRRVWRLFVFRCTRVASLLGSSPKSLPILLSMTSGVLIIKPIYWVSIVAFHFRLFQNLNPSSTSLLPQHHYFFNHVSRITRCSRV